MPAQERRVSGPSFVFAAPTSRSAATPEGDTPEDPRA